MLPTPATNRTFALASGFVLAAASLTACAHLADSHPVADVSSAATPASRTWAVECVPGNLVQHPKTFTLACADANESLGSLTWTGWGSSRATATGKLVINRCRPSCVAGKFVSYPVDVVMSHRVRAGGHASSSAAGSAERGAVWLYTRVSFRATGSHPKGTPDAGSFPLPAKR